MLRRCRTDICPLVSSVDDTSDEGRTGRQAGRERNALRKKITPFLARLLCGQTHFHYRNNCIVAKKKKETALRCTNTTLDNQRDIFCKRI